MRGRVALQELDFAKPATASTPNAAQRDALEFISVMGQFRESLAIYENSPLFATRHGRDGADRPTDPPRRPDKKRHGNAREHYHRIARWRLIYVRVLVCVYISTYRMILSEILDHRGIPKNDVLSNRFIKKKGEKIQRLVDDVFHSRTSCEFSVSSLREKEKKGS